jgi:hypothetical protein
METTERNAERAELLFEELGGSVKDGFPTIHSQVHHTRVGTPYLKTPGVVVLAKPQTNVAALGGFLEGFDPDRVPRRSHRATGLLPTLQNGWANVLRLIRPEAYEQR